jgi:hypothetical protein
MSSASAANIDEELVEAIRQTVIWGQANMGILLRQRFSPFCLTARAGPACAAYISVKINI